jgi:hypothetical protein
MEYRKFLSSPHWIRSRQKTGDNLDELIRIVGVDPMASSWKRRDPRTRKGPLDQIGVGVLNIAGSFPLNKQNLT